MWLNEGPPNCFLLNKIQAKTPIPRRTALYFVNNARAKRRAAKYQ